MAWKKSTKTAIGVALAVLLVLGVAAVIYFRHEISHQIAVTGGRMTLSSGKAELCDLTGSLQTPASYFDKITSFPAWKLVPRGFQVFNNVPIQIDGMMCLWGENNTKRKIVFPEKIEGIAMNRKFESLYVYHTCFFASPTGTPVYELVFRYADGSSETNEICYGTDVVDWYSPSKKTYVGPSGPNSRLAWHTDTSSNKKAQPLRFCLTEIKNPHPTFEVTTIDLYSAKTGTAGCIHAMTTGKSGLMR